MKRFLILAMACSICLTASGCFSQDSGASESAAVTTQPATGKATEDTAPSASVKPPAQMTLPFSLTPRTFSKCRGLTLMRRANASSSVPS